MNVICTKTIPMLCTEGETGVIESKERTRLKRGCASWFSNEVYWSVERLPNLIEFKFNQAFDMEDVKRIYGNEINLSDYFKQINLEVTK